jgi:hypothetical protein
MPEQCVAGCIAGPTLAAVPETVAIVAGAAASAASAMRMVAAVASGMREAAHATTDAVLSPAAGFSRDSGDMCSVVMLAATCACIQCGSAAAEWPLGLTSTSGTAPTAASGLSRSPVPAACRERLVGGGKWGPTFRGTPPLAGAGAVADSPHGSGPGSSALPWRWPAGHPCGCPVQPRQPRMVAAAGAGPSL